MDNTLIPSTQSSNHEKLFLITSQKSETTQHTEVLSVIGNDSPIKKLLNLSFDDFIIIIEIYHSTVDNNETISNKLYKMKENYNDLIKTNTNKVFLFCLNSLYFQYKILNFELENYVKMNSLIQNRIYGDYYKLYNIILSQCKENNIIFTEEDFVKTQQLFEETHNENKNNSAETGFPVYKDIDAFFRYRIEDIILLHQRILIIIDKLDDIYIQKESIIIEHKTNICVGFSLGIFLNTLEYENELLKGQIKLYMEYISFYHASHKRYLNILLKKNTDFLCELDTNILINTVSMDSSFDDLSQGEQMSRELNNLDALRTESVLREASLRLLQGDEEWDDEITNVFDDIPSEKNFTEELVSEELVSQICQVHQCSDDLRSSDQEIVSENISSVSEVLDNEVCVDCSQEKVSPLCSEKLVQENEASL
jgi:hypothetical protein